MRVTEEKTTGREYHLSSGCLPVKQAANAIQFAWWKASLLSFLPSSSNEPRSASFVSAFLRSPNFLPPFLLTAALLPPLVTLPPFHDSLPCSLYLSPPLSSFYLVANCFFFLVTRLDQRFPMSSFLRLEAFPLSRISRRCNVVLEKERGRDRRGCNEDKNRGEGKRRRDAREKLERRKYIEYIEARTGNICVYIYIYIFASRLTREKLFPSPCLARESVAATTSISRWIGGRTWNRIDVIRCFTTRESRVIESSLFEKKRRRREELIDNGPSSFFDFLISSNATR